MPLNRIPFDELRTLCRQRLESLELWLRRLVHDELTKGVGADYFDAKHNGNSVVSSRVRDNARIRMKTDPDRFHRPIDAVDMDDLIGILCKADLFRDFFKSALSDVYPTADTAKLFIGRLVDVRNKLAHANPITTHDAERVFCYSTDVIDSLKAFYARSKMDEYGTPTFVRVSDNIGNTASLNDSRVSVNFSDGKALRPGDTLRIEVEVDPTFDPASYDLTWTLDLFGDTYDGQYNVFLIEITRNLIGSSLTISCTLTAKQEWHRHQHHDASIDIYYKVLPPPT